VTSRRAAPPAALAVAIAGVTIYVLRYALRTTNFLNDEYGAVMSARLAGRDPLWALTATDGFFARGPERLGAFVMAVPDVLLSPT
jgi:hypothetical protein